MRYPKLSVSNKLVVALAAVAMLTGCAGNPGAPPEQVVSVLDEPMHRVVHRDGDLYLLDVQIPPGAVTLAHRHDSAMLYTIVHDADGPTGGVTDSETEWAEHPFVHTVTNAGPGLMHIIGICHYGPGRREQPSEGSLRNPQLSDAWFRSFRIQLNPGEQTDWLTQPNPAVVVQVTTGTGQVLRKDGQTMDLSGTGHWAWNDASSSFRIRNTGASPLELVVNEARL